MEKLPDWPTPGAIVERVIDGTRRRICVIREEPPSRDYPVGSVLVRDESTGKEHRLPTEVG